MANDSEWDSFPTVDDNSEWDSFPDADEFNQYPDASMPQTNNDSVGNPLLKALLAGLTSQ